MANVIKFMFLVLLTFGCNVNVDEPCPEPEPATCPEVACGWSAENTCQDGNSFSYENSSEKLDGGATTCYVYTAACIVKPAEPVSPECIPESCKQNQYTTCTTK